MARIKALGATEVTQETNSVFAEIEGAFGMVPNLFKTYAHFPPLLEANWNKVKAVMMQGSLSRKFKETIAVLVSKDNSCNYCVAAHSAVLKAIGVADEEIKRINEDLDAADFNEKERALLAFARKANREPLKITDDEFDAMYRAGATDGEVIETLGVMEVFTAFNKFLDSLQVEIDF
jgi:uncharacterized peroxidase-related enzyme